VAGGKGRLRGDRGRTYQLKAGDVAVPAAGTAHGALSKLWRKSGSANALGGALHGKVLQHPPQ